MTTLVLNVEPLAVTTEEFFALCQANPELRMERTAAGELIIMPPVGSETGNRNASIVGQLWYWEYLENGAQLGWLIDPELKRIEIYEPGEEVELVFAPEFVAGDPLLSGFRLDLTQIFG